MTDLARALLKADVVHPVSSIEVQVNYWPGLHVTLKPTQSPEPDKVDSVELTVDVYGVQNYLVIMLMPWEVEVFLRMGRGPCHILLIPGTDGQSFVIRAIKFNTDSFGWRQVYSPH